jgi:protease I
MAKVAICVAAEYEDTELDFPRECLTRSGHDVVIVGTHAGKRLKGRRGRSSIGVQRSSLEAKAADFDAIVIPGGLSPDRLRMDAAMVEFVRDAVKQDKLVAAVCHGPQLLIEADVVRDRTMTGWPSIKRDLINAGAVFRDQDVVEDGMIITSRNPERVEAFCAAIVRRLELGALALMAETRNPRRVELALAGA